MLKRYGIFLILLVASQVLTEAAHEGFDNLPAFDLHYWRIRGLAQPLREFATFLGIQFNDITYESGENDQLYWSTKEKAKEENFALINLPYIDDPKDTADRFSESKALFLWMIKKANRLDLLSYDIDEVIRNAQLQGVIDDLGNAYRMPSYMSESKEDLQAKLNDAVPKLRDHKWRGLSEALGESRFLLGEHLKPIDFMFVELLRMVTLMEKELDIPKAVSTFPNLVRYLNTYEELPVIVGYKTSENYITRPFNTKDAIWG